MSKTNHRVNKDREEKLSEAEAHKKRRSIHHKLAELVEYYEGDVDDAWLEEETFEPIRVRKSKK